MLLHVDKLKLEVDCRLGEAGVTFGWQRLDGGEDQ